jgi:type I restriction enzyme, S subunit
MADSQNKKLPKGWRMVRFGDVVRDVNEAERNPLDAGLERYVGLEHIEPENLHLKAWGDLTTDEVSFTKRFRTGQVLFGKRRAYQRKVAVAEFDGICSSDILTFEPKDDALLLELLPFIVQSEGFFEHALGTSSGSLSPRTRWSQLQDYQFPLPPKDEQRRIAEILWAADAQILQLQRVANSLVTLSDALFASACALSSSPIPLADVTTLITDGDHNPPKRQVNGVPHVLVQNIIGGRVDLTSCTYISPTDFERVLKRYRPEKNDVLIVCVGATIGRAGVVGDFCDFSTDRSLAVVRFDANRVHPDFGFALVTSPPFQSQVRATSVGTAQPHLFLGDIRRIKVRIPSRSKQDAVVQELVSLRASISKAEATCDATRKLNSCLFREVLHGS